MRLTLVMPVYKEHRRLDKSVRQVTAFMSAERGDGIEVDVIFVDDGSPDDSAAIVNTIITDLEDPDIRLMRYERNQGKGFAVKTGIAEAAGDLILMSDTDLSTPLEDWRRLKDAIDAGADIACGSRAVHGAHIGKAPPLHRRVLSRVFNILVRLSGVHGIRDTQCGFKLFRRAPAKEIFGRLRIKRFAFDVEMIAMARDFGYKVVEVPVNWDYSGHSTVRIFSSGGRMLFDVFMLAVRRMVFGKNKR